MRRTNIFSREYERKIRKKRFFMITIILIILIMFVVYIVNFSNVNNYIKDRYYSLISKEIASVNEMQSDNYNVNDVDKEIHTPLEENIYDSESDKLIHNVVLGDDEINIIYRKDENNFQYLGLEDSLDSKYSFNISPNNRRILIENNINQDTYMIDDLFNVFKLDPEFFYSNSARSRFYKENVMDTYEGYAWYKDARFLDDNNIVYISNLPWFGKNEEYIWRTDVSDTQDIKHFMTSIAGENIEFGELTEQGIKVNINNEMKLLTFSFVLN